MLPFITHSTQKIMDFVKIILATLLGTTVMTLFSYIISEAFRKLFKEPVLLNILIDRAGIAEIHDSRKNIIGWVLHFLVGLLFVIIYDRIWAWTTLEPSWTTGLIFGAVSGLVGIGAWMTMFAIHPREPRIHFKEYYLQLFFAHILFGLGATAVYLYL
jgi:riboflavin transporter FmnP